MDSKDVLIVFTVIWGMIEIMLFCGAAFGWASLVYIYKDLGFFSNLCQNDSDSYNFSTGSNLSSLGSCEQHCDAQDNQFSLIYAISVVLSGALLFAHGYMYDRLGTRVCRLYAIVLTMSGYAMLAVASVESPRMLYPGLLLVMTGTNILSLINVQLSNLVPRFRSTILALYDGSYCCGAFILLIFQVAHQNGFSVSNCFIIQACLFTSTIVATFTIMPKHKYYSPDDFKFHLTVLNLCQRNRRANQTKKTSDIGNRSDTLDHVEPLRQTIDSDDVTKSFIYPKQFPSIWSVYRLQGNTQNHHYSMSHLNTVSNSPTVRLTRSVDNISKRSQQFNKRIDANINCSLKQDATFSEQKSLSENNLDNEVCDVSLENPKFDSAVHVCEMLMSESNSTLTKVQEEKQQTTFLHNLIKPMFVLILMWICLHRFQSWFFISLFNPWISQLTDHVCSEINFYTSVFATLQFFSILTAPLGGRLMDRKSPVECTNIIYGRIHTAIPTFVIACSVGLFLSIMSAVPILQIQPLTFALHVIHRSFIYGPVTALVAIAFPFEHFGKLLGCCLTMSSIFAFLQYPLIILIQKPLQGDPLVVNIFLILTMCITYTLPYYMWRYVRGKRRKTDKHEGDNVPLTSN